MNSRTIELSGHVIDSLTLPKALDIIMDKGGDFDFLEFEVKEKLILVRLRWQFMQSLSTF